MTPLQSQAFKITCSCVWERWGSIRVPRGGSKDNLQHSFLSHHVGPKIEVRLPHVAARTSIHWLRISSSLQRNTESRCAAQDRPRNWNMWKLSFLQTWRAWTQKWGRQSGKHQWASRGAVSVLCASADTGRVRSSLLFLKPKEGFPERTPGAFLCLLTFDTTADSLTAARVTGSRGSPIKQSPGHHQRKPCIIIGRFEKCGNCHRPHTYLKLYVAHPPLIWLIFIGYWNFKTRK